MTETIATIVRILMELLFPFASRETLPYFGDIIGMERMIVFL